MIYGTQDGWFPPIPAGPGPVEPDDADGAAADPEHQVQQGRAVVSVRTPGYSVAVGTALITSC